MIDLDNLRKLEAAATPRPWGTEYDGVHVDESVYLQHIHDNSFVCSTHNPHPDEHGYQQSNANALLIAAMRNALGPLLSVAQAAEAFEDAQERLEASNLTWGVSDETKAALRADRKAKRDTLLAAARVLKESK